MKKALIVIGMIILALIAISSIGPLIVLTLGACITLYSVKSFKKSDSLLGKVFWIFTGLIGASIVIHVLPALIGIIAVIALVYLLKEWKFNGKKSNRFANDGYGDFHNFEKEWNSMMHKYEK